MNFGVSRSRNHFFSSLKPQPLPSHLDITHKHGEANLAGEIVFTCGCHKNQKFITFSTIPGEKERMNGEGKENLHRRVQKNTQQ
jgi:hypothetical protein